MRWGLGWRDTRRFAYIPTPMDNGRWVWLEHYVAYRDSFGWVHHKEEKP